MAKKLTKHRTNITIVTADFANSIYGGLKYSELEPLINEGDPLIDGHIHSGEHLDGYAQKIDLSQHVTGKLNGENIKDGSITEDKINFGSFSSCCQRLILTVDGKLTVDSDGSIIFTTL
jgi:hypothetical protein